MSEKSENSENEAENIADLSYGSEEEVDDEDEHLSEISESEMNEIVGSDPSSDRKLKSEEESVTTTTTNSGEVDGVIDKATDNNISTTNIEATETPVKIDKRRKNKINKDIKLETSDNSEDNSNLSSSGRKKRRCVLNQQQRLSILSREEDSSFEYSPLRMNGSNFDEPKIAMSNKTTKGRRGRPCKNAIKSIQPSPFISKRDELHMNGYSNPCSQKKLYGDYHDIRSKRNSAYVFNSSLANAAARMIADGSSVNLIDFHSRVHFPSNRILYDENQYAISSMTPNHLMVPNVMCPYPGGMSNSFVPSPSIMAQNMNYRPQMHQMARSAGIPSHHMMPPSAGGNGGGGIGGSSGQHSRPMEKFSGNSKMMHQMPLSHQVQSSPYPIHQMRSNTISSSASNTMPTQSHGHGIPPGINYDKPSKPYQPYSTNLNSLAFVSGLRTGSISPHVRDPSYEGQAGNQNISENCSNSYQSSGVPNQYLTHPAMINQHQNRPNIIPRMNSISGGKQLPDGGGGGSSSSHRNGNFEFQNFASISEREMSHIFNEDSHQRMTSLRNQNNLCSNSYIPYSSTNQPIENNSYEHKYPVSALINASSSSSSPSNPQSYYSNPPRITCNKENSVANKMTELVTTSSNTTSS